VTTTTGGHTPGQFRVVINQASSGSALPGEQLLPSLEVPIPHYRLGTPRFSTRGTAFLHSQIYSRASTNDDAASSVISGQEIDAIFPVPPGVEIHSTLPHRYSHVPPQTPVAQLTPAASRIPVTSPSPVNNRIREPIVPAIYDAIAGNPDDPAIVRYAMSTREISAASPARLIAQITSKNFLDYELLSDFFLTVRSYMSTHDLLAYLLMRFEWAINRFDDDGRVIRVRAFAAIRHWILNYFPYDFVVDRDLRVKFCQHLNRLTHQVRRGAPHDPSDLKLIIDLKKCWNGRCALYWDNPMGESDGWNDLDISPGGIVGSRDSKLTHPSELWAKIAESSSQQVDQAKSVAALHNWVDSVIEAEVEGKGKTDRAISVGTALSMPMSAPLSEQSIPAMSCSIPGKTTKGFATCQTHRHVGPHPVPTAIPPTVRRVGPIAPSALANEKALRSKHEHKRSGSFQDALGDRRTSLPTMRAEQQTQQAVMNIPISGSLIRGSVLPPGSPFIDNLAHSSTSSLPKQGQYVEGQVSMRQMSPGVKSLLGTIRRAIGSKQNTSAPTPNLLSTAPFMVETRDTSLPMHIAYKIEGLGDQHHQLQALKNNSRIDLLCADVTEMFERAITQDPTQLTAPLSAIGVAFGNEREQPSPDHRQMLDTPEGGALQRSHSEMTYGSQSIVIMDDTAVQPPVPSLPSEFERVPEDVHAQSFENGEPSCSIADYSTTAMPTAFETFVSAEASNHEDSNADSTPHSALLPPFTIPVAPQSQQQDHILRGMKGADRCRSSNRTGPSITTGKSYASYRSSYSGAKSLRRYHSYQSGMRRSGPDNSLEATNASDSPPISSEGQFDKPPGRMLRRKPGGDLRANQNVHEMEPIARPRSTGSITTYTESLHNSAAYIMKITARNTPDHESTRASQPAPIDPVPALTEKSLSLVSTQASQPDLRPSFEAAVAEFARIPDDEGGDLEATLAKLEGKFRKSPVGTPEGHLPLESATAIGTGPSVKVSQSPPSRDLKPHDDYQELGLAKAGLTPPGFFAGKNIMPQLGKATTDRPNTMARSLYAESEESYDSTPLVERSLSKKGKHVQTSPVQFNSTMPQHIATPSEANFGIETEDHLETESAIADGDGQNYEAGNYETNLRRGRNRETYRSSMPTCTTDSFLLDEDEFLSDLSSELSDDDCPNQALDQAFDSSVRQLQGSMLPPNVSFAQGYLPSPPMTTENAMANTLEANRIQEQRKPPTPEPSPVSKLKEPGKSRTPEEVDGSVLQPFANKVHQFPPRRHIPFILAFDANVLTEQFTIIERDALNEINWQDLIDMRWQNANTETLNWVEYLRFKDPTGIELVTARFNIVVKWALSEIVLTQNIEERALTLIKYIQVAQNARKHHNYATMLQLTIALTSVDCMKLTKTWDLVPVADKALLKEMEVLVSPLRNFHNLRLEMETANLDGGCIPVIGKLILAC